MLPNSELGRTIPPDDPHAISVSMPSWEAHLGWVNRDEAVIGALKSAYPRFYVHHSIEKLAQLVLSRHGAPHERIMLLSCRSSAERCLEFFHSQKKDLDPASIRVIELIPRQKSAAACSWGSISAVIFSHEESKLGRLYWQHVGEGISTRRAEYCHKLFNMGLLGQDEYDVDIGDSATDSSSGTPPASHGIHLREDISNELRIADSLKAKLAIQTTLAEVYTHATDMGAPLEPSDVYLYPTGMAAVFHTHRALLDALGEKKSICFGFPYCDTFKILMKFGPGCLFYGHGNSEDLDNLESRLQNGERFLALFCEIPGNPLLYSPDLQRIQNLAWKYDFVVVLDDTLSTPANVDVLKYADVAVQSLSKTFSGKCNVMGGSVALNPKSKHYSCLQSVIATTFEDTLFPLDAIVLHENSEGYIERVRQMTFNAEIIAEILRVHPSVKTVYYPKYCTVENYEACRTPTGGYGFMLSVLFHQKDDARVFFDELEVAKGPSLGCNFTLAGPYVLLAHSKELEWVSQYGMVEHLIRLSIGCEDVANLKRVFSSALEAVDTQNYGY